MDMKNKMCIVTGANSGIGKETAKALAAKGAYVVMLCRNQEKAEQAKQEIIEQTNCSGIEIIIADLAHQHDIREAVRLFKTKFDALDILINNAGIIPSKRTETPEGIERTFAVNHLAPFLLTNLLKENLELAPEARIINVSSEVHRLGARVFDINNLQLTNGYSPIKAYGISKLCNIMFTHELAQRWASKNIMVHALHPGVVSTQLASDASWMMKAVYQIGSPFMRSAKRGAETSIFLATTEEAGKRNGGYYKDKKPATPAAISQNDDMTRQLWQRSEELTDL